MEINNGATNVALQVQVEELSNELLNTERSLLEALVNERKASRHFQEMLHQSEEKYLMARQAIETMSSQVVSLQKELSQYIIQHEETETKLEQYQQQREVDEVCKRQMDEELKRLNAQIKALNRMNSLLQLKLDISEGA